MNTVDSITIESFWGNHSLIIPFQDDVNFLIGVNGSGKTTVINLIAAVLTADFETLDRYDFKSISIKLKSGRTRPRVEVNKKKGPRESFPSIEYRIFDTSNATAAIYSLSDLEEQYAIRNIRHISQRLYEQRYKELAQSRGLVEHLRQLVNVRWLSVNRADLSRTVKEDRGFESTVDQKLIDLTQQFAIYFGSLSKAAEMQIEKYQKMFFLSLVPGKDQRNILFDDRSLDLSKEQTSLQEIYQRFKVDAAEYIDRLEEYFEATKLSFLRAKKAGKSSSTPTYHAEDLINIIGIWRIHDLVEKWEALNQELLRIHAPREKFLEILNKLLQRKHLYLNEKNELWVETFSGKRFPVTFLSSGEKQLLIILGEALLQTENVWVYIADEPELSLHVRWQEQLIASIRRVNAKAQIIVATHSPDIVSTFQAKVVDMEAVLK